MSMTNEIFKVLDAGYVTLVDHMGDDLTPLEAARMSTGNETGLDKTKDDNLRDRLWRDKHSSPFEMNVACFEMQVPLFVLRQIDRHRTISIDAGEVYENYDDFRKFTSRNEFSGRYSVMPDLYYIPDLERIQPQSKKNKQGSDGEMDEKVRTELRLVVQEATNKGRAGYDFLVKEGLANELARMVLPQNQYTKIRIQASMSNWFKFLAERLPTAAQWETRQYAKVIGRELRRIWPLCWQVFESNTLYARTYTSHERAALILALEALAAGQAKRYPQRVFMPGHGDDTNEPKREEPRDVVVGTVGKLYKQMGFNDAAVERLVQKLWPQLDETDLLT